MLGLAEQSRSCHLDCWSCFWDRITLGFPFHGCIFLRASPGAASPLSFIAIRHTDHMGAFLALALIILGMLWLGRVFCWHCRLVVAFSGIVGLQILLTWCQNGSEFDSKLRCSWHCGPKMANNWRLGVLLECQCGKNLVNISVLKHGNWSPRIWHPSHLMVNLTFWALPYTSGPSLPLRL